MEDDETVDSTWKVVKKYHHKDWISTETRRKIRMGMEKKAALNSFGTRAEKSKARKNTVLLKRIPRRASEQIRGNT